MPYKDKPIEKMYYSIGEVSEMFNVATSLIRFWETEFDIIKPKKKGKGNRKYTPEDVENIRMVYQLVKEQGYTLQGAKEQIRLNQLKAKDQAQAIHSLNELKDFLLRIKEELD